MKKTTNISAMKLIKKFDEQLFNILAADLKAVKGKVKMLRNNNDQDLLIA